MTVCTKITGTVYRIIGVAEFKKKYWHKLRVLQLMSADISLKSAKSTSKLCQAPTMETQ